MRNRFCKFCGDLFFFYPYRDKTAKYCSKKCGCLDKKGSFHNAWKGGKSKTKAGYNRIRINGSYVYEHRAKAEKFLERKLLSTEVVHHIDGNRLNNVPKNLKIFPKCEHDRFETIKRWKENPDSFK